MNIWLDLELRADIDDFIAWLYCIESNKDISEISINNPTINELKLVKFIKNKFNLITPFIISGAIDLNPKADIHQSLLKYIEYISICEKDYVFIEQYLKENNVSDRIVFCGGSYTNLDLIMNKYNIKAAYIQGGYAGPSIVGKENTLAKFEGREKVPSWNPNLDLAATDSIIQDMNTDMYFISKNVCHNSYLAYTDIKDTESFLYEILLNYYGNSTSFYKCMHDLVAVATIFSKEFIVFKKIDLLRTYEKRPCWYSVINEQSNKQISVSLDMPNFIKFLNQELS